MRRKVTLLVLVLCVALAFAAVAHAGNGGFAPETPHSPNAGRINDAYKLVGLTPGVANRGFRLGQLASGTWVAFTHGANDAQKTMGVIALALVLHRHGNTEALTIPAAGLVAAILYWPVIGIF